MVNTKEFIERLQLILTHYQLTAAALADSIAVQRSSISHLLSGRNKPSLEFVLKVIQKYPEVNLYWFLNGVGKFPMAATPHLPSSETEINSKSPLPPSQRNQLEQVDIEHSKHEHSIGSKIPTGHSLTENLNAQAAAAFNSQSEIDSESIEQVIVFYKKGHFKVYKP